MSLRLLATALLLLVWVPARARAQLAATLELAAEDPPLVRARVHGPGGLAAADFALEDAAVRPPAPLGATRAVTYKQSDQPMALVILIQGNYRWMGNEQYYDPADPEQTRYDGAHAGLGAVIDALAAAGPPGSRVTLLVYGGDAVVERADLGAQDSYAELVGTPLATGLHRALAALAGAGPRARRIAVVVGDGRDASESPEPVQEATRALAAAGVEIFAIHFDNMDKEAIEGRRTMRALGGSAGTFFATSRADLGPRAVTVAAKIDARYDVDFPAAGLVCDGALHELIVSAGGQQAEPATLRLPVWRAPRPPAPRSWWWLWLLAPAPVLVGGVLWLRSRPAAAPAAAIEDAAPAPEPAAEPVRNPTVVLDLGGGEDAMPVVGWVVPLGGPRQYQTFKLQPHGTLIGTGGGSQVVVPDHYMSTEHARIQYAGGAFVLSDNGSTNGVYVNSHKVSRHELVDNDMIVLGQTEFKFKSIN